MKNYEEELDKFVKLLEIKRYAQSTIRNYRSALLQFFSICSRHIDNIDSSYVQKYIYQKVTVEKASFSSQKQIIGAIKLF